MNDNDLYYAVMNFDIIYYAAYLGMGFLLGFQFNRNMEQGYQNVEVRKPGSNHTKEPVPCNTLGDCYYSRPVVNRNKNIMMFDAYNILYPPGTPI